MTYRLDFDLEVKQNKHLPVDADELHAIVVVTARRPDPERSVGPDGGSAAPEAAEVILIDCSGSMDVPPSKISAARRATAAAIDTLRDGVHFAVVAGTETATMVYPPDDRMVPAGAQTRGQAKEAVARLVAGGGTAMGRWLIRARDLLVRHPPAIRHVIMLTDGKNRHETGDELARALAGCVGTFVCDARGIGDDWQPKELRWIADMLLGTADAIRDDSELEADFRAMTETAMQKVIPELRIRLSTAPWARLRFFKQMHPTQLDLTRHAASPDRQTVELPTGSWGGEKREYHLCLALEHPDRPRDEDLPAAHIDLLSGAEPPPGRVPVLVRWTDDPVVSTQVNADVGYYAKRAELNRAVDAGYEAHKAEELTAATREWGKAVRLAFELRDEEMLEELRRVVHIDDAATGAVRLREDRREIDISSLVLRSFRTVPPPDDGRLACAGCGYVSLPDAVFCMRCGHRLRPDDPGGPAPGRPA